jgi:hypothetical protein
MRNGKLLRANVLALGLASAGTASATNWLQFGYDQAHSGNNTAENGYTTSTGNSIAFHKALSLPLTAPDNNATDGIDSAPVYLAGVTTASGQKNLLFATSKFGMLVAVDSATGTIVWSKSQMGHPTSHSNIMNGAPAIDPAGQYVYAYMLDGNVHKFAVGDGTEITSGNWPELSTLKPSVEKGAAGLSFARAGNGTTYLYSVTDGYIGDSGDYQGHITAINLSNGLQNVFNTECSDQTIHFSTSSDCGSAQNGIWGRPGAIYDAGTNRLFISTGNGPYTASTGGLNWGDSVLALNPDGTGAGGGMPVDSYTPTTFQELQTKDADLGSVSIAIVPAPPGTSSTYLHLGVQPGKDGCVRLINLADMSGQGGPAHTGGELDAQNLPGGSNCATGNDGPEIKPQPAVWVNPADSSSWIYVASYNNGFAAYTIALTAGKPSLSQKWTGSSGSSPVVANGTVYYMSGNHLLALDAVTGNSVQSSTQSTWLTTSNGGVHWQSPIVVNGMLYLFDNGNPTQVWAYQLDGIFKGGFQ